LIKENLALSRKEEVVVTVGAEKQNDIAVRYFRNYV